MAVENRGIHSEEGARASATDLKRKLSFSEEENSASHISEDVIEFNQSTPTLTDDVYDYLKAAINEPSPEASEGLWESEDEQPFTISHTSFQIDGENPEGQRFPMIPTDEKDPQTYFSEEGEEAPTGYQTDLNEATETEISPSEFKEDKSKSSSWKQEVEPDVDCDHFDPLNVIADKFVAWITKTAAAAVGLKRGQKERDSSQIKQTVTFVESCGVSWPTIKEFTPEVGRQAIREFITTWYYVENWLCNVQLVLKQSDESSDFYTYESKWGIATKQNPIPQATASVFFVCEVSRVKPANCLVDVTYYFEGCSYIQVPVVNSFNEKQLFDIIYAKLRFYKQLKF